MKTIAFIDGANIYAASKAAGIEIDYAGLLKHMQAEYDFVRAYYYTAINREQEFVILQPLLDWLAYNGYTVVTKPTKSFTGTDGANRIKGNMDVEIAVDMMQLAQAADHIILFSGDGDFRYLVEAVQRQGVRVTVVSALDCAQPVIADELRRQADAFIDLKDLRQAHKKSQVTA